MIIIKKLFTSFVRGPVYILLFGLVFFGIGAWLTYSQRSFERAGAQAGGVVTDLASSCDSDGCSYSPVVRFTTQAGDTVTFESTYSSSPPAYEVGEEVTVIYSPEDPEKAVIQGEGQLFRIIFMAVGGLTITFGLVMFSSNLRQAILAG